MARDLAAAGQRWRDLRWSARCSTCRKARLIATLARPAIAYADDPTNRDPRFTRARLRAAMPALEREGLERRAAGAAGAPGAAGRCRAGSGGRRGAWPRSRRGLGRRRPDRACRRAVCTNCRRRSRCGCSAAPSPRPATKGRSSSASSKRLHAGLGGCSPAVARFRRTLAGAVVTLPATGLTVERAPARRGRRPRIGLNHTPKLLA